MKGMMTQGRAPSTEEMLARKDDDWSIHEFRAATTKQLSLELIH
jgi:hypothetical protein